MQHNDTYIVYLDLKTKEILKPLSKKRDFSIKKHGFNPHITVCATNKKEEAQRIKHKLEEKHFSHLCKQVDWQLQEISQKNNLFNFAYY
jgi:hypothetical protein